MKNIVLEQGNIDHVDNSAGWPLSVEQKHLWDEAQLTYANPVNYSPYILSMSGLLNVEALERGINEIIRRHDILRVNFHARSGVPVQIVRPHQFMELTVTDIRFPTIESASERERLIKTEYCQSFDLSRDLLFRPRLLRVSREKHFLLLNVHPILWDDWSLQNFQKELFLLYKAYIEEIPFALPELPFQYTRFSNRQSQLLAEQKAKHDFVFWKQILEDEPPELNLPTDFPRPQMSAFEGKTYSFTIPSSINYNIHSLCNQEKVTSFIVILTVLNILMHRYSAEEEIRVGTLVSGRNHPDLEPLIGLFANTLVMRTILNEEMTFLEALQQVKNVTTEAFAHQNLPFTKLVSDLGPNVNDSRNPLFKILLHMPAMQPKTIDVPGLQIEEVESGHEHQTVLVDLNVKVTEVQGELNCSITYNTLIFEEETIIRLAGHFNNLLNGSLTDPTAKISLLPMLTAAERHKLLVEWNNAKVDYPRNASIPDLFEEQVKLNPDHVALIFGNKEITYHELDRRANQIANYLHKVNIGQEQLVAICLERSPDMIASFLGVLKAGAAYVPFDLTYPKERIAYMLEDSGVSFVITTELIAGDLPAVNAKVICLDGEADAIAAQPETSKESSGAQSLAYVMYTSGSTGKPKGVMIEHRGIVRLVKNISYASVGPEETYMNLGSVAFDVTAFEIYGALLNGGKLVIMNSRKPTFDEIAKTIQQNRVTSLNVTPDRLNVLLEDYSEALVGLQQILPGGEALPVWLAHKCLSKLKGCRLINLYGPTENAVNTTSYLVKEILPDTTTIPIGRPIANDCLYILDKHLQPVPIGVIGELYMSGDGIGRGYLNKPELTEERFPSDPFSDTPGRKLYRSGDLARYRSDGNVEFVGRIDDQVKIRGCRIELGEIETIVGLFPGVRQSVVGVTTGKDGTKDLVAYVVMKKAAAFDQQKLRSYVRDKLPEYMIPTFFVELQEIPVTPVGKIDRRRLPAPTVAPKEDQITLPRNQIEEKLVQIWEALLDVKPIGITDNFFDLGGNSLLAMRMFTDIDKTFQKKLSVSSIFQEDTIEKLARAVSSYDQNAEMSSSLVAIQPLGTKPPLFCIHGGGGEVLIYRDLAFQLGNDQPLYGLRFIASEQQISVESIADQYMKEIREKQPSGPYSLLGFCYGGAIAFEIAHQLIQAGQEVSLLSVLNFGNPDRQPVKLQNKIINMCKVLVALPAKHRALFIKHKVKNTIGLFKSKFVSNETEDRPTLTKAIRVYKPKPYPSKMLLIRAITNIDYDEKLGWESTDSGSIRVHRVPADHGSLLKKPNIAVVVKFLKDHLR